MVKDNYDSQQEYLTNGNDHLVHLSPTNVISDSHMD